MMQIKKILFSLLLIISSVFVFSYNIKAEEVAIEEGNTTDVAEQNSVIDEQINEQLKEIEFRPYALIIDTLTIEEKELICRITWREAGNQCVEGQRAVMEVILNRLLSTKYPNTILEILSQPHQFSTWKDRDKVTNEQLLQMQNILNLVYLDKNTILNYSYLYFNCAKPKKNDYIKIQNQWFWV